MIQKLEKLIDVALAALSEVRDFYAWMNEEKRKGTVEAELQQELALIASSEAKAPRAGRKAKAAVVVAAPAAPVAPPPSSASKNDKEIEEELSTVVTNFVQRFQKAVPPGVEQVRGILKSDYGVDKLRQLTREQKIEIIRKLARRLAEAESTNDALDGVIA